MRLNCFGSFTKSPSLDDVFDTPRTLKNARSKTSTPGRKRSIQLIHRQGSSDSRATTASSSNDSISRLPPCRRFSESKLEAMMMPVPPEPCPSRCLRMSQPRTYGAIIDGMKSEKGCRDWRSFAVFDSDEIDLRVSAVAVAQKRAADCEQKMLRLGKSASACSIEVDMIG